MGILSKFARKAAKKIIKKKPAKKLSKKEQMIKDFKSTPKKKIGSSGANVKGPITRGKKELRKIIGKPLNTKAEKVVGKRTKRKPVSMKPMTIKEEMKMLRAIGFDIYNTGTESGKYTDKELRDVIKMMRADDKVAAKKKK